ncbi:ImmA/IrrE family metallo-endopeptidase [Geodermatophilus sp. CPCC 205506]|uniref:ImmA/IrrE family metallo-endopeptidase n=1 Tax=Geodermatophilus sp. CPCC 205506 TaxID=2936596 RepID=UPI003EEE2124
MSTSIPALVEPSVLRWARETIDLSPTAAARRIDVPEGRVEAWEDGTASPTVAQLKRAANVYKRALSVFFLPHPPTDFDTMRDFRRVAGAEAGRWSPALHAEYRRAHAQRENALELADLDDATPSTAWRIEPLPSSDADVAAMARSELLAISPLSLPRGSGTAYDHLNVWVAALEEAGVLVLATSGGLVEVAEMRGFSLYFDVLPVIVLNGADSARGRLFSLLHEYAHLLMHTEGLCDAITDARATDPNRRQEARANAVAADILMPAAAVLARPEVVARVNDPGSWDYEALRAAAAPFGVSAEAFLRRLVTLGRVSIRYYEERREEFLAAYEEDENSSRSGRGNWYRNMVRDLGKGYVRAVTDAHRRRVIDSTTAATYLDAKVGQLAGLAEKARLTESV